MVFSVSFHQRSFLLKGLSLIAFAKYASVPLGFSKDRILILSGVYILASHLENWGATYLQNKVRPVKSQIVIKMMVGVTTLVQALPFVATYVVLSYVTKKPFQFETVFKLGLLISGQEVAKGIAGVVNRMLTHPKAAKTSRS